MKESQATDASQVETLDVLVVGAGFSGLYQLDRLRDLGFSVKIYEAAPQLGSVWYWNCYPGARCDTHGPMYQLGLKGLWQDWEFNERFPGWDEIRRYFEYVDQKLDLSRDIRYSTRVEGAHFDEASHRLIRGLTLAVLPMPGTWCCAPALALVPISLTSRACPISRGRSITRRAGRRAASTSPASGSG